MRLRSRVLATSQAAGSRVVREILSWAKAEGLAAVVFPFVLGSDEPLRETLQEAGFASAFYEGDFYLPIAGGDLEGFLRTLTPSARKRFRNDMNRFRRSGLTLETPAGIAEHAETLAEQHRQLMEKYRRRGPELTEESFRRFERLVPDRTFAVARDGAQVVGFALGMYGHGVLHVLRYARDPAADDDARLYGNLVFAEPVRQALALGCTRVHFGKASHLAKAQRGCLYEEGIVFARCTDESEQPVLEAVFQELDAANRERFARLIAPPTPAAAGAR
jgi:predicted N-acyltransferase